MSTMLKSSGAMGLATLASRLLGLVREQVYAHFMGDSAVASAFKLAYVAPNLFRRLLGEGALTAAFIPIFKQKEKLEGERAMWDAANAVLSALLAFASAVVVLGMVGLTVFLALAQYHYTRDGTAVFPPWPIPILHEDTRLLLELLRLMCPYLLLVCLAALCMGVLNARGHFFIPALGATVLNVVMIGTVLWVAPVWGTELSTQVHALAIGIVVAGFAQFGFQLPTLWREGFRFRWVRPWPNPVVSEVVRKMVPATIGVAAFHINVLIIQTVSFWVDRNIVASFDYAVRLMEFPQGIVGISLATYLLPTLSGFAAEKRYDDFRSSLREGLGYVLFINLLASVLLLVLAQPMVRLLFQSGQFTAASTHRTALALAGLAPGLVAYSAVNVLARAFYALGDTTTPMRISVVCLIMNLIVSLWLIGPFRQFGLGIANTITSTVNVWLLLRALRKKLKHLDLAPLQSASWRLAIASVLAGLAAWATSSMWQAHFGHTWVATRLGEVFLPIVLASAVYWLAALALRVRAARDSLSFLHGRSRGGGNGAPG